MFFYRDPYDRPSLMASCLTSLLISAIILALVITLIVYFGMIILFIFLILGAGLGLVCALYACIKSIPQSIIDVKHFYFSGNGWVVFWKKLGYAFICLSKYSISNIIHLAKLSWNSFMQYRFLSFRKWMYFTLLLGVVGFGLIILIGLLVGFAGLIFSVAAFITILSALILLAYLCITCFISFIISEVYYCKEIKKSQLVHSFQFGVRLKGRAYKEVFVGFFKNLAAWVAGTWKEILTYMQRLRAQQALLSKLSIKRWIWFSLSLILPVGTSFATMCNVLLAVLFFIPIYICDVVWISCVLFIRLFIKKKNP